MTIYLYESLDTNVCTKNSKELELEGTKSRRLYYVKLRQLLYDLKQTSGMCNNRLSENLLNDEHVNNQL